MDKCPLTLGMSAAILGKHINQNPFCDKCPTEKNRWTQGWHLGTIRIKVQKGEMSDAAAFEETFRIMGD